MRVLSVFVFLFFFATIQCAKDFRQEARGRQKSRAETLETIFNVYDPTFLSYVWPKIKNGVHLTTSRFCWDDLSLFYRDLAEGHAWAYRTADACGRYGAGALAGRSFWLGDRDQCLLLDALHVPARANNTWGEFYSGDYVSALLRRDNEGSMDSWSLLEDEALLRRLSEQDNTSPVPLSYVVLKVALNVTKFAIAKSHDITLGLCVPRSCGAEDILSLVNFSVTLDTLRANTSLPRQLRVTALRHVQGTYRLGTDVGAVVLILITALLVTLAVIATVVDLEVIKFTKKSVSFDVEQYEGKKPEKKVRVAKDLRDLDMQLKPPSVTLDVANVEGIISSCARCGKYRRQCPMSKPHITVPSKPNIAAPCPRVKYNSCASLATDYKEHVGAFKSLLLSFSLKHSWLKLFNTSMANKDLSVIHGLKIISTLWIIFIHVAVLVSSISDSAHTFEEPNNVYYIILTGTLAFDTLFFASGLFSGHHFFYLKSRYSVEELVQFGGVCGQALQLLCFITNRAIRLLPSYAYVLFLTAVLSRVTRDTAALVPPEPDARACGDHWWRNILYITNAYPNEEQCMQVSWYLSLETQLHVCGALLCLLLTSPRRRVAAALAFALVVSAAVYDLTNSYTDFDQRVTESFSAYYLLIGRPWARVAPYFLGVLTAWILHQLEGTLNVCKTTSYSLWAASGAALAASAALPWAEAWLTAWLHLLWPLGLLWPAVVCATHYAGVTRRLLERGWAAGLSRACYGALLLHGVAARAPLLSTGSALCSSTLCIWWYFAGTTLLTLVASTCLCLLVEMPICSLLRRISDYSYR